MFTPMCNDVTLTRAEVWGHTRHRIQRPGSPPLCPKCLSRSSFDVPLTCLVTNKSQFIKSNSIYKTHQRPRLCSFC